MFDYLDKFKITWDFKNGTNKIVLRKAIYLSIYKGNFIYYYPNIVIKIKINVFKLLYLILGSFRIMGMKYILLNV